MEKILRIEEASFKKNKEDYQEFDGFQIITDKQTIKFGISNGRGCCEQWGYFFSNDSLKEFEGAQLMEVTLTDTALNTKAFKENDIDLESGYSNVMFINFVTSEGVLQFVAYNQHNGYYGHDAMIFSEQLNHEENL